jgi:hypothetical protein
MVLPAYDAADQDPASIGTEGGVEALIEALAIFPAVHRDGVACPFFSTLAATCLLSEEKTGAKHMSYCPPHGLVVGEHRPLAVLLAKSGQASPVGAEGHVHDHVAESRVPGLPSTARVQRPYSGQTMAASLSPDGLNCCCQTWKNDGCQITLPS